MGTSTGYKMPTGGEWTPLKSEANRFVKDGPDASNISPEKLLQSYLRVLGGATGIAGQRGGSSTGGGSGAGGQAAASGGGSSGRGSTRAAIRVGRSLGRFLSVVGSAGLSQALEDIGLGHLVGCTAAELTSGLLDALAGPASTVDDAAARAALARLNEELLQEASSAAEVEQILTGVLDDRGLTGSLMRFFALYIFERFCRDFYERWVKAAGSEATNSSINSVKSYIDATLRSRVGTRDVKGVYWQGEEGKAVIAEVLADTCAVFGVAS